MLQHPGHQICSIYDNLYRLILFGALKRTSSSSETSCTEVHFLCPAGSTIQGRKVPVYFILRPPECPREAEVGLVKGLSLHYETCEGWKPVLLSIQQLGGKSLAASRNCSVNRCRHLAKFLSLQSMGLGPFQLKSKDKLLEALYCFSYANKIWLLILSLSQPDNIP